MRSFLTSSASSATLPGQLMLAEFTLTNIATYLSRFEISLKLDTGKIGVNSATPALPPQPTSALNDAVAISQATHNNFQVTLDAMGGITFKPLSSMPGHNLRLPAIPVPPPCPQLPSSIIAAALTKCDAADRDSALYVITSGFDQSVRH